MVFGEDVSSSSVHSPNCKERVKTEKTSCKPRYGEEQIWAWGFGSSESMPSTPHITNQLNKTQPEMRSPWHHFAKESSAVWVSASISKSTHLLTFACVPHPHPILLRCLRDLGAVHMALMRKSACWSQSCHCLTPLPYANGRHTEPVSPCGYPKESLLDTLTFLSEIAKGAMRKHLQSSHTHLLADEGELLYKLLRKPTWAKGSHGNFIVMRGAWLSFEYSASLVSSFLFLVTLSPS